MIHEVRQVSALGKDAFYMTYLLGCSQEMPSSYRRPCVIICPGGGYGFTSDREAEPVAARINAMGYHAVVLRYSVKPAVFPVALVQLAQTVAEVRAHSDEWHVDADNIFVMGFSAGGHLAASLGTLWNKGIIERYAALDGEMFRPNGLILCYPVITSGEFTHEGSMENLLHGMTELRESMALETRVDEMTPPTFIWHTEDDGAVPVENSMYFATALRKNGVSFELHIFQTGEHGLSLAVPETGLKQPLPNVAKWIGLLEEWLNHRVKR